MRPRITTMQSSPKVEMVAKSSTAKSDAKWYGFNHKDEFKSIRTFAYVFGRKMEIKNKSLLDDLRGIGCQIVEE